MVEPHRCPGCRALTTGSVNDFCEDSDLCYDCAEAEEQSTSTAPGMVISVRKATQGLQAIVDGHTWTVAQTLQAIFDAMACRESRRTRESCGCVCCTIAEKSKTAI